MRRLFESLFMKRIIFATAFVLLMFPVLALSQVSAPKESLRGLRGVFIKILPIASEAQAAGLSLSQIQKIVESELRKAGVPIRTEPLFSHEYASLAITIDTIKHPQGIYLFTVNVSVVQQVQITRPQKQGLFPSETYSKRALGLTTPNRMDLIYVPLKEKLSEFIHDYLAVNSKQQIVGGISTPHYTQSDLIKK